MNMKSFTQSNCLKRGMSLPHLQKVTMNVVKQLLQPHLVRRVQQTIKCLKTCLTPSKVNKAPCRPKVEPSVCNMCDEVIPCKRDTIALQPVSCDACCAMLQIYHLRCEIGSSASAWLMDL